MNGRNRTSPATYSVGTAEGPYWTPGIIRLIPLTRQGMQETRKRKCIGTNELLGMLVSGEDTRKFSS